MSAATMERTLRGRAKKIGQAKKAWASYQRKETASTKVVFSFIIHRKFKKK